MSGDPRCLVCKGSGSVDAWGRTENCACVDVPKRDPYAPPKAGWVDESIREVMALASKRHAEAEAHAKACNDRPCKRCERFICACGKPFDGAENHRCRDCWKAEKLARVIDVARERVPKRFRWAFDGDVDALASRVKGARSLIERGMSNPPTCDVMFSGDTAAGKTSLAVAMFGAWVRLDPEQRVDAMFAEAYLLAGARARHPLGQGEAPAVVEAMQAPLLLIDDVGSEVDDRRNVVADVVFHRHNEELPTWITTGFTVEMLMGRYGSHVVRRLIEHGKRVALGSVKP